MRCKIIKTGWDQSLKWVKTAHFSYNNPYGLCKFEVQK